MADEDRLNEDAELQIDGKIIKLAEEYNALNRRSKDLSDDRKVIRENVEKLGVHALAWQHAVKITKDMTEGERRDYQVSMNRVMKVIGERAGDLFPEAQEAANKRAERKAKITGKEGAPDPDANPRSDPNAGGAKPRTDEMAAGVIHEPGTNGTPPDVPGEQGEGEAALAAAMPKTKQAQSAKAAEKLAAAKLN